MLSNTKIVRLIICVIGILFTASSLSIAEDANPPSWAGAAGSHVMIWDFDTAAGLSNPECIAGPDAGLVTAVAFDTLDNWYASNNGRTGVAELGASESVRMQSTNTASGDTVTIRTQLTLFGSDVPFSVHEISGCFLEEPATQINHIDLGGGWHHYTFEDTTTLVGCPEIHVLFEGSTYFIDQIIIDVIHYSGALPVGSGRSGCASGGPDTDPPSPDPATWSQLPTAITPSSISMIATTGGDSSGVEYFFDEVTGNPGGSDSGWQSSPSYTDTGLSSNTTYSYRVKMRDLSPAQNETSYSTTESDTTPQATGAVTCPQGDLNDDCKVDLDDLKIFAAEWLALVSSIADFIGNDGVNNKDFSILSTNWLLQGYPLVINEVMADNETTIQDPDEPGEYPDWIEIYNNSLGTIDMSGMFLTDNGNQYQIPNGVTIAPGEFKIFWADNDSSQGPTHTNFALSNGGETVSLIDADGSTLLDQVTFPALGNDLSHGRFVDASVNLFDMGTPTPGASNQIGQAGIATFSVAGGTYATNFSLGLTTESPTASIYYTTDGSVPNNTGNGTLYSTPFTVSATNFIRARVYDVGTLPGPITSETYIKIDSSIQSNDSNLPIVVIDTFGGAIPPSGSTLLQLGASVFIDTDNVTGRASIIGPADYAGRGGIRSRGNSSSGFPKQQYKFETWDEDNIDLKTTLLGFPTESDWILHAPWSDRTLMRNHFIYNLSRDVGQYASRTKFFELYINQSGDPTIDASHYLGVYVLMEKIKRDPKRVDIERVDPFDNNFPEVSGGYLFKKDWDDREGFNTSIYDDFLQYVDPDGSELNQTQKDWVENWFTDFETALSGPGFADPINGYAKYIDCESFIEHHILVELSKNVDGFILSTYLYKDREKKLVMGPIWDYNGALGGANYFCTYNEEGWHHMFDTVISCPADPDQGAFGADNPNGYEWYKRLLFDPLIGGSGDLEFRLKYADKWFDLREDQLDLTKITTDIDNTALLLTDNGAPDNPVVRNFATWDTLNGTDLWPDYLDDDALPHSYQDHVDWLKLWLTNRLAWMDGAIITGSTIGNGTAPGYAAAAPPVFKVNTVISNVNKHVNVGDSLTMELPAGASGTIYYTTNGTDPRLHGGAISPYATAYSSAITLNATSKFRARVRDGGGNWGALNKVKYAIGAVQQDLRITEIMYHPLPEVPFVQYSEEQFEYIEVKNIGTSTLDLKDVEFTDGIDFEFDRIISKDFDPNNTGGFTYADDIFGTTQPLLANGSHNSTGGLDHSGALHVNLGGSSSSGTISGGWSRTFNLTKAETVTVMLWNRLVAGSGYDASEFGEAVLTVNGIRHGAGPGTSLARFTGPGGGDTGWVFYSFDIALASGSHTIALGAFSSATSAVDEVTDVYFDEVKIQHAVTLAPGAFAVVVNNIPAFESRYGTSLNVIGEYTDSRFSNSGEEIVLRDAIGVEIHDFNYNDTWYPITDGQGFSLTIVDENSTDPNSWDMKSGWRPSSVVNGTPAADDTGGFFPDGSIEINEILAHSDTISNGDFIELHNTTGLPINIGGWFLSDNNSNFTKYAIATGTTIPANGYVVFHEVLDFGNAADPGSNVQFAFSENGETAYLTSGDGTNITGAYSTSESFGASEPDIAFGRYFKVSTQTTNFVAMSSNTPGSINALPKVGPVVINEIMYHPNSNGDAEFIELLNISGSPVTLYDAVEGEAWKITDGVDYTFPSGSPITLASGEYFLLIKNQAAFTALFGAPSGQFAVWTSGSLSNGGERVEISSPGELEGATRHYIRQDRVNYSDGSHPGDFPNIGSDPWPTAPDGSDTSSLSRTTSGAYGNDPANWHAATPSPGAVNN